MRVRVRLFRGELAEENAFFVRLWYRQVQNGVKCSSSAVGEQGH